MKLFYGSLIPHECLATEDSYKAALGMGKVFDEHGDLLHAAQRYYGNANQPRFLDGHYSTLLDNLVIML